MNIDRNGDSELMLLADLGKLKRVELLLPSLLIEDINYQNEYGNTALMLAANHNHKAIVDLLIAAGADGNIRNSMNQSAAVFAYRQEFDNIVAVLPDLSIEEKEQERPAVVRPAVAIEEPIIEEPIIEEPIIEEAI